MKLKGQLIKISLTQVLVIVVFVIILIIALYFTFNALAASQTNPTVVMK